MRCPPCGSDPVGERPERTAQGCRRFRWRACGKQFNERTGTALNRAQYPADIIALVVLWRLRYQLSWRDLVEMFLARGTGFGHEAARTFFRSAKTVTGIKPARGTIDGHHSYPGAIRSEFRKPDARFRVAHFGCAVLVWLEGATVVSARPSADTSGTSPSSRPRPASFTLP